MELGTLRSAGATKDRGPGGFWRPPGKTPVGWDTQEGGPNVVEYPGPTFRDIEVGSMIPGDTVESTRHDTHLV